MAGRLKKTSAVPRFYFDHNATTPISAEVLEVHVKALREVFGNASSIHHEGQAAKQQLEKARAQVAGLLRTTPKQIVFTSGGTEANNLAIFGTARMKPGSHIVTTALEHPAVLRTCQQLEREGHSVTYVAPDSTGVVSAASVEQALRPNTSLVTVMHVNNELGTIQPIQEIAPVAHKAGIPFHSDGVQAAGRIPVDVGKIDADLYSVSAHKMYGPKGIGGLYVRKGTALTPLLFGGNHEGQRRAGTENVPAAVAFGAAAARRGTTDDRVGRLRDLLEHEVESSIPGVRINGFAGPRVPNTTNLAFEGVEAEGIVIGLDLQGFSISTGSACSSGAVEPSHVLKAIGLSSAAARSSVRISLGEGNTEQQVLLIVEALKQVVNRLRAMSPAYIDSPETVA